MSGFFIDTGEIVHKRSENLEFPARLILGYQLRFSALHMFFCDTWNHAWKTGWKVYVSTYESYQLLRMCLKY